MAFTDKFDKEDYYMTPEGYLVFTEKYHLKRGYCCQSGCLHCPWKDKQAKPDGVAAVKPENPEPENS
jgi:hypothetical protein